MEQGEAAPAEVVDNGLMSLGQAAAWLGWRGRNRAQRLKRTLLAIERRLGHKVMVNHGKHLVTRGAIQRWAPELCAKPDDLSRMFRSHLRNIDRRIDKRLDARVAETVELQISKLWEFLAQVTESINKLNERIAVIGGHNRAQPGTGKAIG